MVLRKVHSMGKVSLILGTSLFSLMTFPRWGTRLKHSELPPTYSLLPLFWQSGTSCCSASRVCTYTHACMTGIVPDYKHIARRGHKITWRRQRVSSDVSQHCPQISTFCSWIEIKTDEMWNVKTVVGILKSYILTWEYLSLEGNRVTLFSQSRECDSLIQTTYYSITLL